MAFVRLLRLTLLVAAAVVQAQTEDNVCLADDDTCSKPSIPIPPLPLIVDEVMKVSYGEPQKVAGERVDDTLKRLQEVQTYMYETVFPTMPEIGPNCKLNHENCAFWAVIGECTANPKYMKVECAPACFSCDQLSFESRCPLPEPEVMESTNIWKAGDLNTMFEGILQRFPHAKPHFRPGDPNPAYSDSPWVVTLDDFLTAEECQALIDAGAAQGYERSKDVGAKKFDGTYDALESTGRTSSNAWCVENCYNNTETQSVLQKLENLTGIPDANSEYLQLLQYGVGQFYQRHHDYIPFHKDREQGVRILTAFLYLNDVEEGTLRTMVHNQYMGD